MFKRSSRDSAATCLECSDGSSKACSSASINVLSSASTAKSTALRQALDGFYRLQHHRRSLPRARRSSRAVRPALTSTPQRLVPQPTICYHLTPSAASQESQFEL